MPNVYTALGIPSSYLMCCVVVCALFLWVPCVAVRKDIRCVPVTENTRTRCNHRSVMKRCMTRRRTKGRGHNDQQTDCERVTSICALLKPYIHTLLRVTSSSSLTHTGVATGSRCVGLAFVCARVCQIWAVQGSKKPMAEFCCKCAKAKGWAGEFRNQSSQH